MSCVIWWLRRDLRLHDNPALAAAVASGQPVVPVYIHAPEEEAPWPAGAAACWWLHHSLEAISEALAAAGSPLLIRQGQSLAVLRQLAEQSGATAVYWNRLYEPARVASDREIKQQLCEQGLAVQSFNGALLCEPWELRTANGGPYRVFTPFWRKLVTQLDGPAPRPAPQGLKKPAQELESMALTELNLLPTADWTSGLAASWCPGETGALARLEQFRESGLAGYEQWRDLPACDGVSGLSPWLHHGEISPRQVLAAVRERPGAEAFIRQLGWREFAHHVLFNFADFADKPLNSAFGHFPWRHDHEALLTCWQRGQTGFPVVDAGMRQLWHSGWMHNRVRMIVASLLVKNIRAPWQAGARWFWDTLVDADLANNSLGWQWAGGCGADAAPYFRIFNPVRQGQRFDPEGAYVKRWLPELRELPQRFIHCPWEMSDAEQTHCGVRIGRDYPEPVVDLKRSREQALEAFRQMRNK